MILDALLQFSGTVNPTAGQTVTGASTTVTSTNVIDLQTARDLGQGGGLEVMVEVNTAFVGGTSVQCQLVEADDAAISVNVTPLIIDYPVPIASMTAGAQIVLHWDRATPAPARRYIAMQYVLVGTVTAGALSAFVVKDVQDKGNNTIFPSGFSVS